MFNKLRPSSVITAASSLIKPCSHRTLKTSTKTPPSNRFHHGESITLSVIVPTSKDPQLFDYETTDELAEHVKLYRGLLSVYTANRTKFIPFSKYAKLSPSITYQILSPFFGSMQDERQHRQVADKAFEDKSRKALLRYLEEQQYSFRELSRVVKVDGKIVAEWEGVFELEGGEIWFLECKHCVTIVFYPVNLHLTVI